MTSITAENLPAFKAAFLAAEKAAQQTFTFEGAVVLVDYARYVIQYLEERL